MTSVSREVSVRAEWTAAFDVFTEWERFPDFMGSVDNIHRDPADPALVHWQVSIASVPRTFTTRVDVDREHRTVRFALDFETEGLLEKPATP